MGTECRLADPDRSADVAAVAGLRHRWRTEEGGESGDLAEFETAFGAWWRDHADSHLCCLAERRGTPLGMAWLGILHRVPGPERFVRLSGMVQSVYVVPEERGAGVGAALVDAVITIARERDLAYLGVHPSERSYPLYERAGFHATRDVLELGLSRPRTPLPAP